MMKNLLFIPIVLLLLIGCKDKDRDIDTKVEFTGSGFGGFEICFYENGNEITDYDDLGYHIYVTTKNNISRDVERTIYNSCDEDDMCQIKKLGAYTDKEYDDMEKYFVPGNIKSVKVEIFYDGEYNEPFLVKEYKNL